MSDPIADVMAYQKPVFYDPLDIPLYSIDWDSTDLTHGASAELGYRCTVNGARVGLWSNAYKYYTDGSLVGSTAIYPKSISFYLRQRMNHAGYSYGWIHSRIMSRLVGPWAFDVVSYPLNVWNVTSFVVQSNVITVYLDRNHGLAVGRGVVFENMNNGAGATIVPSNLYTLITGTTGSTMKFSYTGAVNGGYTPDDGRAGLVESTDPATIRIISAWGNEEFGKLTGNINVNDEAWHTVGITISNDDYSSNVDENGHVVKLYIDGIYQGEVFVSSMRDMSAFSLFGISGAYEGFSGIADPTFEMAHFAVFDRLLSAQEFRSQWAATRLPDFNETGYFVWTGSQWKRTLI